MCLSARPFYHECSAQQDYGTSCFHGRVGDGSDGARSWMSDFAPKHPECGITVAGTTAGDVIERPLKKHNWCKVYGGESQPATRESGADNYKAGSIL